MLCIKWFFNWWKRMMELLWGLMQIFVIGPVKEVRKAEAILRGRMIDYWREGDAEMRGSSQKSIVIKHLKPFLKLGTQWFGYWVRPERIPSPIKVTSITGNYPYILPNYRQYVLSLFLFLDRLTQQIIETESNPSSSTEPKPILITTVDSNLKF